MIYRALAVRTVILRLPAEGSFSDETRSFASLKMTVRQGFPIKKDGPEKAAFFVFVFNCFYAGCFFLKKS